ncbi:hypothetical protein G5A78_19320 [[Clostridium] scindens]|nr:hypothetical protein [[Clostridium] scindens]
MIEAKDLHKTVIKEPDAQTQSRRICEKNHSLSALRLCVSFGHRISLIMCTI